MNKHQNTPTNLSESQAKEVINRINNKAAATAIGTLQPTAASLEEFPGTVLEESEKSLTVGEIPQKIQETCGDNPEPGACKYCSTVVLRDLDNGIFKEMNRMFDESLVSYGDSSNINNGAAVHALLQPEAEASLKRIVDRNQDATLYVNSAYRSIADQYMLKVLIEYLGLCYPQVPVADVGESNHQRGLAVDIDNYHTWSEIFEAEGWTWGQYFDDPPHFAYSPGRDVPDMGSLAIKAFQQLWNKHNISDAIAQDGLWGPNTQSRLEKSPIGGFSGPEYLYLIEDTYMEGSDIRKAQEILDRKLSSEVTVDGIYGPSTREAVTQFQQQQDLAVDGIIGPKTREAMKL